MKRVLPKFIEMEAAYGSIAKAFKHREDRGEQGASGPRYSLFVSLKNGMESLTDALMANLPDVQFQTCARVTRVSKAEAWTMELESGESQQADVVCFATTPATLSNTLDLGEEDRELFSSVSFTDVAILDVAFDRKQIKHPLDGFGFVVPASEKKWTTACSFLSVKFPGRAPEGKVVMRAFVGGALGRAIYKQSDTVITKKVILELGKWLGISGSPEWARLQRWPKSMPQYELGHEKRVREMQRVLSEKPGLFATGNAYSGVGIPDCIREARRVAQAMATQLKKGALHVV